MIGLSLSAIGKRPLADCLTIAAELAPTLPVEFIELAIGVDCFVADDYRGWPLVLHDNCLRNETGRLRLDPLQPRTWTRYQSFAETQNVVAIGVHAPAKKRCTLLELERALASMEQHFSLPVQVEIMPGRNRWCSSLDTLPDHRLLLDLSHALIWTQGNLDETESVCHRILDGFDVGEIHLSHNNGLRDSHDLIPPNMWFDRLITQWQQNHLVTYESLPEQLSQYRRLDQARHRALA